MEETEGKDGVKTLTDYQTAGICFLGHRDAVPVSEPFFHADPIDEGSYALNEFQLAHDRSWLLN